MRAGSRVRVLVTGSRGKSSVARLLHAALNAAGVPTCTRITGVVPRHLGPDGTRVIMRGAGAHVGEMRWWLEQLPRAIEGVVLENSAIAPELQHLAGRWLQPQLTVLTATSPDHAEAWGPHRAGATEALAAGIPRGSTVIAPASLAADADLARWLGRRDCNPVFAQPAPDVDPAHRAAHLGLALATLGHLGLASDAARQAMLQLPRDTWDFRVAELRGIQFALAFTANDPCSSAALFRSLAWLKSETRLVYNHRADRPARYRSFRAWLEDTDWADSLVIGDRPAHRAGAARYQALQSPTELLSLFQAGDRVFGCGNVAGLPLALAATAT